MSQNRLGIATVVLLLLVGLTMWRMNARTAEDKAAPSVEVKLPKIDRDKLDELELSGPDKPTVRMVKKGTEWRLAEPLDAKADQDAVKAALDKLGELEATGVAATKAENHERLEVDAKKGTHVIARAAGKSVIDGFIGTYQSGNTMFRLQGQDTVATVKGSIRYAFGKLAREWRDRTISKVEAKDLHEIVFDGKNGHFDFVRDGEDWKQVVGKKEKRVDPLDQSKIKSIVGTATSLSAVDFAEPAITAEQAGLGAGAATVVLDVGGDAGQQRITYRVGGQKDQNFYLQRDGVDTLFLVSSWVGGRLMIGADALVKKDPAPGAEGQGPVGSPQNPIPVEPFHSEIIKKLGPQAPTAAAKPAPTKAPAAPKK